MSENRVCGIDEAGRGPLAGPVTAAAVILGKDFPVSRLNDSKKLSAPRREELFWLLQEYRTPIGIGWSWPEEIDRINILQASLIAMARAFEALPESSDYVIVDGRDFPAIPAAGEARIKADAQVPAVMAASIVAKVVRDQWMLRYSWFEPEYGYERHKGYPTRAHREACLRLGPSPIQRLSFTVAPLT